MSDTYKQDGVDIAAGDVFSAFAGEICRRSYENSPFVKVTDLSEGNFRGPRGWRLQNLPEECILTISADGIGTKVGLGNYKGAAYDLIGMSAMDITRDGGLPLVFTSILDVVSLGEKDSATRKAAESLLLGLAQVASKHGYVILTGETAELGPYVGSENPNPTLAFNWGGCMTGVYHPQKMISGETLAPGQAVIALADTFRSNGISSVRKALALQYGNWWENPEAQGAVTAAAAPSVQYDRFLNQLHGWFDPNLEPLVRIHLIAHLTGGAFNGKFADLLRKRGLSAKLDNLFDPPAIMRQCFEWRKRGTPPMVSADCYKTWNGGQGVVFVVDKPDAPQVIRLAGRAGIPAQIAGEIISGKPYSVSIISKFDGQEVLY